jgi:hypothetical protein
MVKVINISVHEAGLPLPCLGDTLHMTRVRAHSPEATSYVCLSARSAGPWEAMLLDGIYRFSKLFSCFTLTTQRRDSAPRLVCFLLRPRQCA